VTNLRNGKNPHFVGEDGGAYFLKTLSRAQFLQRNLIEGSQHGITFLRQVYANSKLSEGKYFNLLRSFLTFFLRFSSPSLPCSPGTQRRLDIYIHGGLVRLAFAISALKSGEKRIAET